MVRWPSTDPAAVAPAMPRTTWTIPSHMIGATSGRAATLASRLTAEIAPKWCARTGAGERHVGSNQNEQDGHATARSHSRGAEQRRGQRTEEHHVLPADREHVREARSPEVVAQEWVDALVLPQHHPPRDRGLLARR